MKNKYVKVPTTFQALHYEKFFKPEPLEQKFERKFGTQIIDADPIKPKIHLGYVLTVVILVTFLFGYFIF